jgi:DNA-binding winged helix-turn-helix (wHTH) protein
MAEVERQLRLLRFDDFEVDLRSGELRKAGVKLKFGGQPFQVLSILLERPGEVVTREELQKRLWPDTFVDVDHNLNTAINRIREVLGDSAESPRYVETLPRRGYRFIGEVEPPVEAVVPVEPDRGSSSHHWWKIGVGIAVLVIGIGVVVAYRWSRQQRVRPRRRY